MMKEKANKWYWENWLAIWGKNLPYSLYQNKFQMIKIWSHNSNRKK